MKRTPEHFQRSDWPCFCGKPSVISVGWTSGSGGCYIWRCDEHREIPMRDGETQEHVPDALTPAQREVVADKLIGYLCEVQHRYDHLTYDPFTLKSRRF